MDESTDRCSCPFVLLAHYGELDWVSAIMIFGRQMLITQAAQYGAEADLVRISVGLEDEADLSAVFKRALNAASSVKSEA